MVIYGVVVISIHKCIIAALIIVGYQLTKNYEMQLTLIFRRPKTTTQNKSVRFLTATAFGSHFLVGKEDLKISS